MNANLKQALIFTAGVGVGSAFTWKLVEARYKKITDEEIKSVKEAYSTHVEESSKDDISEKDDELELIEEFFITEDPVDEEQKTYETMPIELGYVNYSKKDIKTNDEKGGGSMIVKDAPYVISPDDFGEMDYECVSLTYYADGVLVDDCGEVVEDIDYLVGEDSLTHFGDYEDDSVFVRNDMLQKDFEILMDEAPFYDEQ